MKKLYTIFAIIAFIFNLKSYAQTLDTSFSDDGIQTTSISNGDDFSDSSIIQPDGKIVVSATTFNGLNYDVSVIRYNIDGTLDNSFGNNGVTTINTETIASDITSIAIQSNGKIVVASTNKDPNSNIKFYIIRLNANGSLDYTFNGIGIQTIDVNSYAQTSVGLQIQNDGKIIIEGSTYTGTISQIFINRYNTNGSLDISFGNNGVFKTNFTDFDIIAQGLQIQGDGKILAIGLTGNLFDLMFDNTTIIRLNSNGSYDTTFNSNGIYFLDIVLGSNFSKFPIVLQSDEKIVIGGNGIVRLNNNGGFDVSFGNNGLQNLNALCNSIAIQTDGKILLSSFLYNGTYNKIQISRFKTDGTIDNTFNSNGIINLNLGSGNDFGTSINLGSDDKIVVTGSTYNGSNYDIFALRYINTTLNNEIFTNNNFIKIYPNPTSNNFIISNLHEIEKVEVYDINGRFIKNITTNYNISDLNLGVYLLKIYSQKTVFNSKIVKK